MKFKLQQTNLEFTPKSNPNADLNVVFSFGQDCLVNAVNLCPNLTFNPLAELALVGNTTLCDNQSSYLVVSLGEKAKLNLANYITALKSLADFLTKHKKISTVNLILEEQIAELLGENFSYHVEQTIFHVVNSLYYFDELKTNKKTLTLKQINCVTNSNEKVALSNALALLEGVCLVKHLANNPANIITPSYLAKTTAAVEKLSKKVKVEILEEKELKKMNMNSFLAVAQGSNEASKFIKMEYIGGKPEQSPIVLVGKGITFDSGGISIKPSMNMNEMKYDMCGAATVIGVFLTTVKLGLPINLVTLVPSCENLPSGKAVKPGDVVTSMSGTTIEILNTDAEGRLILCDALTYAEKYKPELVIDVATLTGACITALGNVASGLFSNDDELANSLMQSAKRSNDKVWQLPLFEEYEELLKSSVADLSNIGGWTGAAGSATAATFLSKFVNYKWAHLDIAGTAWRNGYDGSNANGATGRPFYLLIDFLRQKA